MTDAYIPQVTEDDVIRIIGRDYPDENCHRVLRLLRNYGTETWHCEVDRVRVAILKLASGDRTRLPHYLYVAHMDFRDVLFPAECPRAAKLGLTGEARLFKRIN